MNQHILTKEICEKIDKGLFPTLKNINIPHKQHIITFCGVPGAGKTTLSKQLEEKYHMVRIGNDSIRKIISSLNLITSPEEAELLFQEYNFYLISHLPFKNKRIILDKSMDRQYKPFFETCKSNNLKYFIIRLNVSDPICALKRLSKREKIIEQTKVSMKRWFKEYNDCAKNLKADVTLNAENPNLDELYRKLDNILRETK